MITFRVGDRVRFEADGEERGWSRFQRSGAVDLAYFSTNLDSKSDTFTCEGTIAHIGKKDHRVVYLVTSPSEPFAFEFDETDEDDVVFIRRS